MLRLDLATLSLSALLLIGCEAGSKPNPQPDQKSAELNPAAKTSSLSAAAGNRQDVTLDVKSWDETLALVAEHKGKVVVLDLWSTSCEPCVTEFPHLVELQKKHGDKIVCMSASCDYIGIKSKPPESYLPKVLEFLKTSKATFQNVLLNVEPDVLFEKIDLASIPAVYVFGTDGKIAKRFDNDAGGADFTYAKDIEPFVDEQLKKSGE